MNISEIPSKLKTGPSRASLFNLIVFTQKNARADYLRTIAHNAIVRFPSRVIFITADRKSHADELSADVKTIQTDVMCDWIDISATEANLPKIPFIILPHLLTDLPIYVVWGEDPTLSNPIASALENLADRLIFDSETTDHLSRFAKAALDRPTDIADLCWARTESWRQLLAAVFHGEERALQLKRMKSVGITYNSVTSPFFCHTQTQSRYLRGWLESQLNWKNVQFSIQSGENKELAPGAIISLDMLTTQGEHFAFVRTPEQPHQVKMMLSTPDRCEIPSNFIFTKTQAGLSLVNEIGHTGTSAHFLKLMETLSKE
ncbi:MAG: glucose-6-phosphate dehydrogenase assembly protein OpcA [Verrucomicrobia bacterium]|nr:glucose-6-phosphate dehydrogenase assembly protein OpcA [Verrucomicrobiota bacterium]